MDHGKNGVLVNDLDSGAFSSALVRLLGRPDEAVRMGRAARETAIARFSADQMVDQTLRLYECLMVAGSGSNLFLQGKLSVLLVVGTSARLGLIQKSIPSQKLYACRINNKERAMANAIQISILELVDSAVKSRNSNEKRNRATTAAVVAM